MIHALIIGTHLATLLIPILLYVIITYSKV